MSKERAEATSDMAEESLLPEYDFGNMQGGVRGKYYKDYREGHTVEIHKANGTISVQYFRLEDGAIMLEPDVRKYFPDSEAVNRALRGLIALAPQGSKQTNPSLPTWSSHA